MTDTATEAIELAKQIAPLLRGKGPDIQGAALADLVARFIAGHNPALRELQIAIWTDAMRELIPLNEAQLKEQYGALPWEVAQ